MATHTSRVGCLQCKYSLYPANMYLFKVNNRNTRKRYKTCSKLTISQPFSSVSIADSVQINS